MRRKFWSKTLVLVLTLSLLLGLATVGSANTRNQARQQIAEIFGEYDLQSEELITVIVELNEPSVVEAKHNGRKQSKDRVKNVGRNVVNQLESKIKDASVNREYQHLFAGFSVELPQNQIPVLLSLDGVKAVYPNVQYQATQVGEGIEIPWDAIVPNMMDSGPFIGAKEAWKSGFNGEGITVAILDTGVDYTHPDLVHAFGDYKGWDFVDNDNDPQEGPGQSHGTHVAGTVAANGVIKGVAPKANLLAYRVLGPEGGTTQDVVAAIELAVLDGADIMNLSLGNRLNAPDWATSIALDWAMAEGVVAVTSNGNSGPNNWTVGSPGASKRAISVGATQLPYDVYSAKIFTSEGVGYPSSKVMGYDNVDDLLALNGNTYEFEYVGLGLSEDFKDKDLDGKIALIMRGVIPFVEKAENAKAAGAVGAIIFNHLEGEMPDIPGMAVPTIKTTLDDGIKLFAELTNGNNKVAFDIEFFVTMPEMMANFSSRGPAVGTWMIKPDVSAPGVNIVSTVPGGYAAFQGTSMSSPHVAGAAALLLQKHPDWTVDEVKAALMNTAEELIDPATGKPYPHNTQGAGSIRIVEALTTETLVIPGSHSFGKFVKEDGRQVERQSFTIKNLSDKRTTYSFDVEFEGNPEGIKVTTSNNLRVNPGRTQQVNMNVQVDTRKLEPGYYEGKIKVSDGSNIYEVPTILFVGEPDYPRVASAYIVNSGGTYYVGSYLPAGGEIVEYHLFEYDNGRVGPYIGFIGGFLNAPRFHEFVWDGKVNGIELPNGEYVLAVYVEQAGVTQFVAFAVEKN